MVDERKLAEQWPRAGPNTVRMNLVLEQEDIIASWGEKKRRKQKGVREVYIVASQRLVKTVPSLSWGVDVMDLFSRYTKGKQRPLC